MCKMVTWLRSAKHFRAYSLMLRTLVSYVQLDFRVLTCIWWQDSFPLFGFGPPVLRPRSDKLKQF
jgi:hypothetical protein